MSTTFLVAQLATALVSHHVAVRFTDAHAARVHEELTYDAERLDDPYPIWKTLVRELEPTTVVARGRGGRGGRAVVHRVSDGVVRDETGLGLALDVPLYSEREHDVRVVVEWPHDLQLHWRITPEARPVLDASGPHVVLSFTVPLGAFTEPTVPPEDDVPHLGLSAVTSWEAVADAYRDEPDALPEALREEAATAHPTDAVAWVRRWLASRKLEYRSPPKARRSLATALASPALSRGEALRVAVALLESMGRTASVVYAGDPLRVRIDPEVPDARLVPVLLLCDDWVDLAAAHGVPLKRWQQGLKVFTVRRAHFTFDALSVTTGTLRVESDVKLGTSNVVRERQHRTGFFYVPSFEDWLPAAAATTIGATELKDVRITARATGLDAQYTAVGALQIAPNEISIPISQWLTQSVKETAHELLAAANADLAVVPLELEQVTRFHLPPGMQLLGLSNLKQSSHALEWEQRVEVRGAEVTVTRRLSLHQRRVALEELPTVRELLEQWARLPASARLLRVN